MASGFIFAFKLYIENDDHSSLHWVEHAVKKLTDSDIIHVEMIPVLGGYYTAWEGKDGSVRMDVSSLLFTSHTAHTAVAGSGYKTRKAKECFEDSSFQHIFVPMPVEKVVEGISFLEDQEGKWYNYLALPLTVIQHDYKLRSIDKLESCLSSSKVFCSQMGLVLCYLSNTIDPHENEGSVFLDPLFCTPAELYYLIRQSKCKAMQCTPSQILVMDEGPADSPVDSWGPRA